MSRAPGQAPTETARASPVERFLGREEASGGPFALLGVSPAACTDESVLAALDRQLDRVAHHIECDTPEADEVRLALHAAAAQLLDPAVRRHLTDRWLGRTAPPPARPAPAAREGVPVVRRTPAELLLEHDAVLTLGMLGGWNRHSLHRLVALAHARGLSSEQVAGALRTLATRRRPRAGSVTVNPRPGGVASRSEPRAGARTGPPGSTASASPAEPSRAGGGSGREARRAEVPPQPDLPRFATPADSRPLPEQIDPAQRLLRNALIFGGIGIIVLAVLIALIVGLLLRDPAPRARTVPAPPPTPPPANPDRGSTGAAPDESTAPQGSGRQSAARSRAGSEDPRQNRDQAQLAGALRQLAACPDALGVDPEAAVARFEHAVGVLAAEWCRVPRDRLVATHDAVVEFLYRAGADPEISGRALDAIGSGAGALAPGAPARLADDPARIWPAAWSLGMLVRLSREKDLSAATREAIETRIGAAVGHGRPVIERSFEAGAASALQATPGVMLGGAASPLLEAWRRWAEAADALAGTDRAAHDSFILSGLDALLILGPEPDADRAVLDGVGDLVPRVSWRSGDEARTCLLRWFDDRRVTPADLQAVTSALATKSGAEGVDLTMVLSSAASERVRADLRDRFARVWGIAEGVDRGAIAEQWEEDARVAIERSYAASSPVEHLAAAALLSRLNEAAWRLWKGDNADAARILGDLSADIDAAPNRVAGAPLTDPNAGDGGWAERYLAARRNLPLRLDQLTRLSGRAGVIGPVDAEILAGEALAGSPVEIRTRASELVRAFAHSPAMVNALLEALPRAPRIIQNGALIAYIGQRRLPPVRDPAWPAEARRALVETLLEVTAAEGELAAIDRLSHVFAVSWRGLASESSLTPAQRSEPAQPPAHVSAAAVRARWRETAGKAGPVLRSAGGPDLAEIDRRHAGRVGLAFGLVQAFAAEHVGVCDLMAYVVAAEQPARTDRARAILAELAERRRTARHIFEQLNAAERAAVQLWLARAPEAPA